MTSGNGKVIAVLNDLLFTVKIQAAAKQAGVETLFVKSREQALEQAREQPAAMILDLNDRAINPLELIEELKKDEATRGIELIGFVSHVQADLRQAAQEKGCDVVVARSAFVQNLPAFLKKRPTT